jgi:cytochrome c556
MRYAFGMFRTRIPAAPLATLVIALLSTPADTAAPDASENIDPLDIIAARQALMVASEDLMRPIDTFTVDESIDPELMRANAAAIAAMLLVVPPLFPQNTNLYDADAEYPLTLALPPVWDNFQGFYGLAAAAADAATALVESLDSNELRSASLGLRGACDACHSLYLLPYEAPEVKAPDANFDFDFGN